VTDDETKNYVLILYPTNDTGDESADGYGPITLADAYTARESVLRGTPNVGIEIVLLHEVGELFKRSRCPSSAPVTEVGLRGSR
jgi:hypothetical protein